MSPHTTPASDQTAAQDPKPRSGWDVDSNLLEAMEGLASAAAPHEGAGASILMGSDGPVPSRLDDRLDELLEEACHRWASRCAVSGTADTTFGELSARSNQLARYLINRFGVRAGDRVAVLLDRSVETYIALLAIMKANAIYVPLDSAFPAERLRYIAQDAAIRTVLTSTRFRETLQDLDVTLAELDTCADQIAFQSPTPLTEVERGRATDPSCYIIYTSGTTGTPKGVVVEHPSICNFVRVAAARYGYAPGDRVYQGMTIAFDFSTEEIWVPLSAGATIVPAPPGMTLLGEELGDFLREQRITCMCSSPTLLATIESDVPLLRALMVGGEACPPGLVVRWSKPGRTILNTYGPTEATVTASACELLPGVPVTIGQPLATYSLVILDPEQPRVLPRGMYGEIGIAGIGLAAGYLNRDELTRQKFVPDFLDLPNNPSRRIYRTGDLGRVTPAGEVEYNGRIDTQVKIRGYRIELLEIEAALLDQPGVGQAAVTTWEKEEGQPELVAYYAPKSADEPPSRTEIMKALRARLPAYMVPGYLEEVPFIPMTVSNKADHRRLPKPTGTRVAEDKIIVAPRNEGERLLAYVLGEVLKIGEVSVEDHVFDDLGANSLDMARFCARLRHLPHLSALSMRDIYAHPSVAQLAEHLHGFAMEPAPVPEHRPHHEPSDLAYYGCGALQLLFYAAYGLLTLWAFEIGFEWAIAAVESPLQLYLRSVALAAASFVLMSALPIVAKWLLVGRWKAETFPIWGLRYFRLWVVMTLTRTAPVVLFRGSPMFSLYLRLLGAKIGRNTVVETRFVPVCTDLISIGDNAILRKETVLLGYRAQGNAITTGPVAIGRDAFVGEASVLDIDTEMGAGSQLGHGSSLQSGQRVPPAARYHGSPAVATSANYCPLAGEPASPMRRALYDASRVLGLVALVIPLPFLALAYGEHYLSASANGGNWFLSLLVGSLALFVLSYLGALTAVTVVPRLCSRFLVVGKVYPLYGVHHWLQSMVSVLSNSQPLNLLFGDSSAVVHYMRLLGWKLNKVEQTGSNFGTNQRHDNPLLCEIGSGTMVSDGLSMINLHKSASSFQLLRTRIGDHNYLGNNIHYPPNGRTGDNCLLGTKVMVPVDGHVRENVGLLGSPCFEIPRMVSRDRALSTSLGPDERRERLTRKNAYNLNTALLFLLAQWALLAGTLAIWHLALSVHAQLGVLALFLASVGTSWAAILFYGTLERASLRFRSLEPKTVTIYDPYFWSHERHWKLSDSPIMRLFPGTPFKNVISRLVGLRVGRKVFDAGCIVTDRTLTVVGDGANLNEGSVLQAHSLEEGVFKSDRIVLGEGCTVGPNAFVHYGVTMQDRSVLEADSFLMKGEVVDSGSVWCGNPARPRRTGESRHTVEVDATCGSFVPRMAAE